MSLGMFSLLIHCCFTSRLTFNASANLCFHEHSLDVYQNGVWDTLPLEKSITLYNGTYYLNGSSPDGLSISCNNGSVVRIGIKKLNFLNVYDNCFVEILNECEVMHLFVSMKEIISFQSKINFRNNVVIVKKTHISMSLMIKNYQVFYDNYNFLEEFEFSSIPIQYSENYIYSEYGRSTILTSLENGSIIYRTHVNCKFKPGGENGKVEMIDGEKYYVGDEEFIRSNVMIDRFFMTEYIDLENLIFDGRPPRVFYYTGNDEYFIDCEKWLNIVVHGNFILKNVKGSLFISEGHTKVTLLENNDLIVGPLGSVELGEGSKPNHVLIYYNPSSCGFVKFKEFMPLLSVDYEFWPYQFSGKIYTDLIAFEGAQINTSSQAFLGVNDTFIYRGFEFDSVIKNNTIKFIKKNPIYSVTLSDMKKIPSLDGFVNVSTVRVVGDFDILLDALCDVFTVYGNGIINFISNSGNFSKKALIDGKNINIRGKIDEIELSSSIIMAADIKRMTIKVYNYDGVIFDSYPHNIERIDFKFESAEDSVSESVPNIAVMGNYTEKELEPLRKVISGKVKYMQERYHYPYNALSGFHAIPPYYGLTIGYLVWVSLTLAVVAGVVYIYVRQNRSSNPLITSLFLFVISVLYIFS